MNVEKLKNKARKLEDKGSIERAIDTYLTLLQGLEGTGELVNELALFNRVGDLYTKMQKVPEAVDMYERAANLYAEYGFPNNAIALCNKVLRNAPGRTHVYLRLAQLMVERGLVAQAKQNLLEYAERMQTAGKTDEAFRALKEFADLSPDNEEIRLLLAEQLKNAARTAEAREQLAKLFAETEAKGDARRSRQTLQNIKAIDPDFDPEKAPKAKVKAPSKKSSELVFLDLDEEYRPDEAATAVAEPSAPPTADLPLVEEVETAAEEVAEEEEEAAAPAETGDLVIETSAMAGADAAVEGVGTVEGLEIERTSLAEEETVIEEEPEPEVAEEEVAAEAAPAELGLEIERTSLVEEEPVTTGEAPSLEVPIERAPVEMVPVEVPEEEPAVEPPPEPAVVEPERVTAGDSLEIPELDLEELELPAVEEPAAAPVEPAVAAEAEAAPSAEAPDIATLEARVADNPDDARAHVALGEALIEEGQRERGIEELDIAVGMFEAAEEWTDVRRLVNTMLRLDPNSVRHHQKRVEAAFRSGEKRQMVEAYLGLANALVRSGTLERAEAVFKRVLEYDPNNAEAKEALAGLMPEEPPAAEPVPAAAPAGGGDYVDLGALIFDDEVTRDTRMRIEDEEPTGDEERDFNEMLSQFKRGIEQNLEDEDWQAHYDLGVAFKEMGLLDEAIAEFQKALRSPAGRLRTAEALGSCFFEKGQFSVAATVMRRAVETDPSGDESKIALLYWMGRCAEELGKREEALASFQRVFALDIRFADVADRVQRLAAAGQ